MYIKEYMYMINIYIYISIVYIYIHSWGILFNNTKEHTQTHFMFIIINKNNIFMNRTFYK